MNPHVIIVHFPIAFLSIYSIFEFLRFSWLLNKPYWFYIKACLVIIGSGGTVLALLTGDIAKELIRGDVLLRSVANVHENFADATTSIFAILAISYLILVLQKENLMGWVNSKPALNKIWNFLLLLAKFFVETKFVILLALAGLICVTITGGLGGAMAFGPQADPLFAPIYHYLTGQ